MASGVVATQKARKQRHDSWCCLGLDWDALVEEWSSRTHSIVAQETSRMRRLTEEARRELGKCRTPAQKAMVRRRWREELTAAMETAQDLMQCVVNDVVETTSTGSGSSSDDIIDPGQNLGNILEEELCAVVLTKKKTTSYQDYEEVSLNLEGGQRSHQSDKSPSDKDTFWMENEVSNGCGHWRKDLESPSVWMIDTDQQEGNKQGSSDVEDIFADWLALLKKQKQKHRRRSKKKKSDHLNSFGRRCSGSGKGAPGRPVKSYWNIFSEWKKNLREPPMHKKTLRKRQRKRTSKNHFVKTRTFGNNSYSWFTFRPVPTAEDFFSDAREIFSEEPPSGQRSRRRSREDLDESDGSRTKRFKREAHSGDWDKLREKSCLVAVTIEERIRNAFRQVNSDDADDEDDDQELVGGRTAVQKESHEEFCELRDEVRRMRKRWRRRRSAQDTAAFFHEWRWHLVEERDEEEAEDFFQEWKSNLDEVDATLEAEDFFNDWLTNLEDSRADTSLPGRSSKGFKVLMRKSSGKVSLTTCMMLESQQQRQRQVRNVHGKATRLDDKERETALRKHQRRMTKCYPKQPWCRGRN